MKVVEAVHSLNSDVSKYHREVRINAQKIKQLIQLGNYSFQATPWVCRGCHRLCSISKTWQIKTKTENFTHSR